MFAAIMRGMPAGSEDFQPNRLLKSDGFFEHLFDSGV
jgi:hypothetical protein